MKILLVVLLLAVSLDAQTHIYLRSSGPEDVVPVSVAGGSRSVVTYNAPHGWTVGDKVTQWGICTGTGASRLNGTLIVAAAGFTSITASFTDLAGSPISTTDSINCDPYNGQPGSAWAGKVTDYTLGPQPLGWLDGLNGNATRRFYLSTENGLTSLIVSGNVATVTTSFDPKMVVGDKVAVWNSTNAALNTHNGGAVGTPYVVTSVSSTGYTFATTGVPNGNYTLNMNCGPTSPPTGVLGTNLNCTVVSQMGFVGNPWWDANAMNLGNLGWLTPGNTTYKQMWDGGSQQPVAQAAGNYSFAVTRFMVDRSNRQMASVLDYAFTHLVNLSGVNWTANDTSGGGDGGTNFIGGYLDQIGQIYMAWNTYATPTADALFLDNIYADWDDPSLTACSYANGNMARDAHNEVLGSGLSQAGSSNTITLAPGDSRATGYYIGTVIHFLVSGSNYYGRVTANDGPTKIATISGTWGATPVSGTAYTIYATMSSSSPTPGGTATITGIHTMFLSHLSVGDAVIGSNPWVINLGADVGQSQSIITAVNSDTSLTVTNAYYPIATTMPSTVWYVKKRQAGDCGLKHMINYWIGEYGSQPVLYPTYGGNGTGGFPSLGFGNNNAAPLGMIAMDFVAAPKDTRAVRDLSRSQSAFFRFQQAHYMNYLTGFTHSGAYYGPGVVNPSQYMGSTIVAMSVPTFPSQDLTGPWLMNGPLEAMYGAQPDFYWDAGNGHFHLMPFRYAANSASPDIMYKPQGFSYMVGSPFKWAPASPSAAYYMNWLATVMDSNLVGYWGMTGDNNFVEVTQNDPRIPTTTSFTAQPTQYAFTATSAAACSLLTGYPCDPKFSGAGVISRTGWSRATDSTAVRSASLWSFMARSACCDYDLKEAGHLSLYKVGELLGEDTAPPNNGEALNSDMTVLGDMLQFDGTKANTKPFGIDVANTPINRWASANHGTWDPHYGDKDSQYMAACTDMSGAYTLDLLYSLRCVFHSKPTGGDEFMFQLDTHGTISNHQIEWHKHYTQNGETGVSMYPEGTTTCPAGCGNINTAPHEILSLEDGGTALNSPARNFGVITHILSPGSITVRDDTSAYAGGAGHTHRFSICAGTCGSNTNTVLNTLVVDKVTSSLGDTSLVTVPLNPDANWTGAQATGALSTAVFMGSLGGITHSTMTAFTTTHTGTAQYLFGGLTAGIYVVKIGGRAVTGSPFNVVAGDNSIAFASTAGTVSINGGAAAGSSSILSGKTAVSGNVVIH